MAPSGCAFRRARGSIRSSSRGRGASGFLGAPAVERRLVDGRLRARLCRGRARGCFFVLRRACLWARLGGPLA
eukprot:6917998-Pyramimonas_sp.AAC.1